MGVSFEELSDEFDIFGEEVDDDELFKLQEMCKLWSIDANRIVNEWMAFSASKRAKLNSDTLEVFDREWLPKKVNSSHTKIKTPREKKQQHRVFNKDTINSALDNDIAILGSYATPEEKSKITQAAKRQLTPEDLNAAKRLQLGRNQSPHPIKGVFSPLAASPAGSTPSAKYSSRSNAGDVVCEFGSLSNTTWAGEGHVCNVSHFEPTVELNPKVKYMFQKMSEKAIILNDVIQEMGTFLQNAHGIEEYSHVALPSQESVTVCGRVCCDSIGRLNKQSVLLEGSRETSAGKCISLDLSDLKQFSMFPGQVISCDGVNPTGKKFAVNKIYNTNPLPFHDSSPDQETGTKENVSSRLSVTVAVGPYAPSNSLDYSPLSDLVKYVCRDKPDLLVLMGPFVDTKNTLINSGDVEETYDEIFAKHMIEISRATEHLACKVVIMSSHRDVHHCSSVYPQPPYSVSSMGPDGVKRLQCEIEALQRLMFVPDPCTLKVNGVVLGLTSTDILMHLTKSEVSVGAPGGSDRMSRLAQHILHQHSYYPLHPPSEEVCVDYELWEAYAKLPVTPHVLVLPSDLKAFVKDVEGCICVNPGRLTTGTVGGTYARMVIDIAAVTSSQASWKVGQACHGQIVKV